VIAAKGMQMILKSQVFSADSSVEKSKKGLEMLLPLA
jgi:hypothetical protein